MPAKIKMTLFDHWQKLSDPNTSMSGTTNSLSTVGDSLRETIDRGLTSSRFGIVVLSPSFFGKRWPNRELNGLMARETGEDRHIVLPIWHDVDRAQVLEFSPPLADLHAARSVAGIPTVVDQLLKTLRPEESPLVVARDFLLQKGVSPPVVTDEWWLDVVEFKEAALLYPDLNPDWRWIFPLPFQSESHARERGINIAWTALQRNWADDGTERKICQLTHPEKVHSFLRKWPGLQECARNNPATLALYVPQLTISGFDDGFADKFDELNSSEKMVVCEAFRYGRASTVDEEPPLCGDFIAWRHPTYGNYTPGELSYEFVNAHNGSYSRRCLNGFECLIWLLSDDSIWMPEELREILKKGFKDRVSWWITDISVSGGIVSDVLYKRPRSRFAYTRTLKKDLVNLCERALHELAIDEDPNKTVAHFIEWGFLEGFYDEEERIREARRER